MPRVNVIGAGLAGCECAWQLSKRGIAVRLFEMKPHKKSPAHTSDFFAELVCSNSLRSNQIQNAVGLLKEEMRLLDSLIIKTADRCSVPAGGALAVDRDLFSKEITSVINNLPNIEIIQQEIKDLTPFLDEYTVIATGPLTSQSFSREIERLVNQTFLHFYDAAAPIVDAESIDTDRAFYASRYQKGGDDYLNCPMNKEEYDAFYQAIIQAEVAPQKRFEKQNIFEGCMPIEAMAKRGYQTMLFGPLKPKGLTDPKTQKQPFAIVQLRKENDEGTMFNIVGFQTHLKFPEQRRVFGMIPALKNAEFLRYGVMHRNTYLQSPALLDRYMRLRKIPNLRFAGQITGVEGYVESASNGLLAGIFTAYEAHGKELPQFGNETAAGALCEYVSSAKTQDFQPMNVNFGIIRSVDGKMNKKDKNERIAKRAMRSIQSFNNTDQIFKEEYR